MPEPPKIVRTTKRIRKTSGATAVYSARPPATPANLRLLRLRTNGGRGGAAGPGGVGAGPAPVVIFSVIATIVSRTGALSIRDGPCPSPDPPLRRVGARSGCGDGERRVTIDGGWPPTPPRPTGASTAAPTAGSSPALHAGWRT